MPRLKRLDAPRAFPTIDARGPLPHESMWECAILLANVVEHAPRGLAALLLAEFADARFVTRSCADAVETLHHRSFDLTLVGTSTRNDAWFDNVPLILASANAGKLMLLTEQKDPPVLRAIRGSRNVSAFDTHTESLDALRGVLRMVIQGRCYLSASLRAAREDPEWRQIESMLTAEGECVLATLGCGCDNHEAGRRLNLHPGAVATWRKRIMRLFNLHHRGELSAFAFRHGFTVNTPEGTVRPGVLSRRASADGRRRIH